ncbi:MAG TPA: hypothetical protein VGR00_06045 [Thermoanaerobaculia bacterium]|jgi:hypothetical protein|nr:hypothetical protein [Thermoanaerobaculia bacterium]
MRRFLPAVALLLSSGCFSANSLLPPKLSGEIAMRGPNLGDGTFVPAACQSGDYERFYGVDLVSADGGTFVRVVEDAIKGPLVRVMTKEMGPAKGVLFSGETCAVLKGAFDRTGWRVNGILDFKGEFELECKAHSGDEIRGKLSFVHCH